MFSKFVRPVLQSSQNLLLKRKINVPPKLLTRKMTSMIPPSQYDTPIPRRLYLTYALRVYWEIIPLFLATMTSLSFMVLSIIWACTNKVDVVFTSRSRNNISRTMDLRNPSVHKIIIINQRYEPWPEMQDVLDKMKAAERRALMRMLTC